MDSGPFLLPVSGIAALPGKEYGMTKYFMRGTKHAAFERMMMEAPKGPGRVEPQKKPRKRKLQHAYQKKGAKE